VTEILSAYTGGYNVPKGQAGQHYHGGASSTLGSSLDTGGNGGSTNVTTTNGSVHWEIGTGNGFTSYGTGTSAVLVLAAIASMKLAMRK
jgi:hypothetical protein